MSSSTLKEASRSTEYIIIKLNQNEKKSFLYESKKHQSINNNRKD